MLVVPEEEVPGLDTTSSILLRLAAPPSKSSLSFLTLIRGGIFATAGATVVPAPAAEEKTDTQQAEKNGEEQAPHMDVD